MEGIRLIAADLDDTLVRPDKSISDYTAKIFGECRHQGLLTAFVTARMAVSVQSEAQVLNPHICIVSNGAMTLAGGEVTAFHAIEEEALHCLLQCLVRNRAEGLYVDCGERVYTNSESYLSSRTLRRSVYTDFRVPIREKACQVFFRLPDQRKAEEVREAFPDFGWVAYRDGTYAVVAAGVSKMEALLEAGRLYGIGPDGMAAFGDDEGDREMLAECRVGVAMGNALPSVKEAAGYVTKTNGEDGAAWFIERYFLNP